MRFLSRLQFDLYSLCIQHLLLIEVLLIVEVYLSVTSKLRRTPLSLEIPGNIAGAAHVTSLWRMHLKGCGTCHIHCEGAQVVSEEQHGSQERA